MSIEDLLRILRECAGAEEGVTIDESILDTDFDGLGYDSIALLEITSRIERDFDVRLDDESIDSGATPRNLHSLVNDG
ncbi:acyl carrier protein [Streptomonospora wellingtoniae]|uniref:Acyl carrier protein n=1 Tax=Streptomonospora wellingtoniae TaxID=3075544 RepID=A0ABU2KXF7_9ACTN|nr:acyl carrier protein [Streptomonospora sp. DSM 45055]MDT0303930.1 acyl carrier protein [Streptomonospora sp. DSM 45055]